jgi:hypothetical protein
LSLLHHSLTIIPSVLISRKCLYREPRPTSPSDRPATSWYPSLLPSLSYL